jgi:hypothetical protein
MAEAASHTAYSSAMAELLSYCAYVCTASTMLTWRLHSLGEFSRVQSSPVVMMMWVGSASEVEGCRTE